jgi:hypothetical protein
MRITKLANDNLELQATEIEQDWIKGLRKSARQLNGYAQEAAFIAQHLRPCYEQTSPASVGALTSAPLITDGIDVWGFMDYQVTDFLGMLEAGHSVIFVKG